MNIITLLYMIASVAVIIYTGDELRRIAGHRHLRVVVACTMVCIGAFGGLCEATRHGADVYDLALSLGVALYCAHRHRSTVVLPS